MLPLVLLAGWCDGARAAISLDRLPRGTLVTAAGRDYRAIRDLTLDLAKTYPPERHYFVNVSQVSTPVIAMMRAIYGPRTAGNLPLSYLKHLQPPGIRIHCKYTNGVGRNEDEYRRLREKLYTPETIRRFRAELLHALPSPAELNGRRIVFIEWANEGFTITNLSRELRAFRRDAPGECPASYVLVGLTHGRGAIVPQLKAQGVVTRTLVGRQLAIFDDRVYRDFAEFGAYTPARDVVGVPPSRRIFHDLVFVYREVVLRDPHVQRALGAALPPLTRLRVGCERALTRGFRRVLKIVR